MKNKENFYEFVNKMNSNINFEAVLKYYQKASLDERMLFYNRINYIIRECLKIIKEYKERIIPLPLSRRRKYEKK